VKLRNWRIKEGVALTYICICMAMSHFGGQPGSTFATEHRTMAKKAGGETYSITPPTKPRPSSVGCCGHVCVR
jgi:hypothetical protein